MAIETLAQEQRQHSQYIDFWNSVLVPKFIRWKHIIVDGLTLHSEAIFPSLLVNPAALFAAARGECADMWSGTVLNG